ncbi:MAG: hypothetical protein ACP5E3_12055 [Bacteroidales bacterium]
MKKLIGILVICLLGFALFVNAQPLPQENEFEDEGARVTCFDAPEVGGFLPEGGVKIAIGT